MRDYQAVQRLLSGITGSRDELMARSVDVFWESLSPTGVSWIGYYTPAPDDDGLVLGPRRDKPACSPIGMHGACGQSFESKESLVIRNVASLGEGYVACDPRDVSELIVPLFDRAGNVWGVLDADSFDEASFDERDAHEMRRLLERIGLSATGDDRQGVRVI